MAMNALAGDAQEGMCGLPRKAPTELERATRRGESASASRTSGSASITPTGSRSRAA